MELQEKTQTCTSISITVSSPFRRVASGFLLGETFIPESLIASVEGSGGQVSYPKPVVLHLVEDAIICSDSMMGIVYTLECLIVNYPSSSPDLGSLYENIFIPARHIRNIKLVETKTTQISFSETALAQSA